MGTLGWSAEIPCFAAFREGLTGILDLPDFLSERPVLIHQVTSLTFLNNNVTVGTGSKYDSFSVLKGQHAGYHT